MTARYRWDVLYDSMAREIDSHRKTRQAWGALSQEKGLTKNQYLAARLTQVAQQELDFSFQMQKDWQHICHVLTNVLDHHDSRAWREIASRYRCTTAEAMAGGCLKYVAHAVDFMDYLEFRMAEKSAG
jgi:hypothetical protein